MSWSNTRLEIEALLSVYGFTRAPEIFDIEQQPATFIDKVFCIQIEETGPNTDGFGDVTDRFFPTHKIKISVLYELFNGNQEAYDAAIDKNMRIIQLLIDPNKRPTDVRICGFEGTKTKLFKDNNNWLIIDNSFNLQVEVKYPPEFEEPMYAYPTTLICHDKATLDANGTVTVLSNLVTTADRIFLNRQTGNSNMSIIISAIVAGISFTITSTGGSDDAGSEIGYLIL